MTGPEGKGPFKVSVNWLSFQKLGAEEWGMSQALRDQVKVLEVSGRTNADFWGCPSTQ